MSGDHDSRELQRVELRVSRDSGHWTLAPAAGQARSLTEREIAEVENLVERLRRPAVATDVAAREELGRCLRKLLPREVGEDLAAAEESGSPVRLIFRTASKATQDAQCPVYWPWELMAVLTRERELIYPFDPTYSNNRKGHWSIGRRLDEDPGSHGARAPSDGLEIRFAHGWLESLDSGEGNLVPALETLDERARVLESLRTPRLTFDLPPREVTTAVREFDPGDVTVWLAHGRETDDLWRSVDAGNTELDSAALSEILTQGGKRIPRVVILAGCMSAHLAPALLQKGVEEVLAFAKPVLASTVGHMAAKMLEAILAGETIDEAVWAVGAGLASGDGYREWWAVQRWTLERSERLYRPHEPVFHEYLDALFGRWRFESLLKVLSPEYDKRPEHYYLPTPLRERHDREGERRGSAKRKDVRPLDLLGPNALVHLHGPAGSGKSSALHRLGRMSSGCGWLPVRFTVTEWLECAVERGDDALLHLRRMWANEWMAEDGAEGPTKEQLDEMFEWFARRGRVAVFLDAADEAHLAGFTYSEIQDEVDDLCRTLGRRRSGTLVVSSRPGAFTPIPSDDGRAWRDLAVESWSPEEVAERLDLLGVGALWGELQRASEGLNDGLKSRLREPAILDLVLLGRKDIESGIGAALVGAVEQVVLEGLKKREKKKVYGNAAPESGPNLFDLVVALAYLRSTNDPVLASNNDEAIIRRASEFAIAEGGLSATLRADADSATLQGRANYLHATRVVLKERGFEFIHPIVRDALVLEYLRRVSAGGVPWTLFNGDIDLSQLQGETTTPDERARIMTALAACVPLLGAARGFAAVERLVEKLVEWGKGNDDATLSARAELYGQAGIAAGEGTQKAWDFLRLAADEELRISSDASNEERKIERLTRACDTATRFGLGDDHCANLLVTRYRRKANLSDDWFDADQPEASAHTLDLALARDGGRQALSDLEIGLWRLGIALGNTSGHDPRVHREGVFIGRMLAGLSEDWFDPERPEFSTSALEAALTRDAGRDALRDLAIGLGGLGTALGNTSGYDPRVHGEEVFICRILAGLSEDWFDPERPELAPPTLEAALAREAGRDALRNLAIALGCLGTALGSTSGYDLRVHRKEVLICRTLAGLFEDWFDPERPELATPALEAALAREAGRDALRDLSIGLGRLGAALGNTSGHDTRVHREEVFICRALAGLSEGWFDPERPGLATPALEAALTRDAGRDALRDLAIALGGLGTALGSTSNYDPRVYREAVLICRTLAGLSKDWFDPERPELSTPALEAALARDAGRDALRDLAIALGGLGAALGSTSGYDPRGHREEVFICRALAGLSEDWFDPERPELATPALEAALARDAGRDALRNLGIALGGLGTALGNTSSYDPRVHREEVFIFRMLAGLCEDWFDPERPELAAPALDAALARDAGSMALRDLEVGLGRLGTALGSTSGHDTRVHREEVFICRALAGLSEDWFDPERPELSTPALEAALARDAGRDALRDLAIALGGLGTALGSTSNYDPRAHREEVFICRTLAGLSEDWFDPERPELSTPALEAALVRDGGRDALRVLGIALGGLGTALGNTSSYDPRVHREEVFIFRMLAGLCEDWFDPERPELAAPALDAALARDAGSMALRDLEVGLGRLGTALGSTSGHDTRVHREEVFICRALAGLSEDWFDPERPELSTPALEAALARDAGRDALRDLAIALGGLGTALGSTSNYDPRVYREAVLICRTLAGLSEDWFDPERPELSTPALEAALARDAGRDALRDLAIALGGLGTALGSTSNYDPRVHREEVFIFRMLAGLCEDWFDPERPDLNTLALEAALARDAGRDAVRELATGLGRLGTALGHTSNFDPRVHREQVFIKRALAGLSEYWFDPERPELATPALEAALARDAGRDALREFAIGLATWADLDSTQAPLYEQSLAIVRAILGLSQRWWQESGAERMASFAWTTQSPLAHLFRDVLRSAAVDVADAPHYWRELSTLLAARPDD